jgi:hypothetical protein
MVLALPFDSPLACLVDPPRRVGREAVSTTPVVFFDGGRKADRSLLDEVEKWYAVATDSSGCVGDQSKARGDERLARTDVAALACLR